MIKLPKKFCDRVQAKLKHYQKLIAAQQTRDVSEADTVTLIKDILCDVFGYDKYSELTSEQQIRGTFCDLLVQVDGSDRFLIEVKSAGAKLSAAHLRQAVNYGTHHGLEWIILTNAVDWKIYRIKFTQPIDFEEVAQFCLLSVNPRSEDDLAKLFLLAREGQASDAISSFDAQRQIVNAYTIAQLVMSDGVISLIRREMRRLFPDLKVEADAIATLLANGVLKREVVEGERVVEAKQRLKKANQKLVRTVAKKAAAAAGA
jgi:hypothetical protein